MIVFSGAALAVFSLLPRCYRLSSFHSFRCCLISSSQQMPPRSRGQHHSDLKISDLHSLETTLSLILTSFFVYLLIETLTLASRLRSMDDIKSVGINGYVLASSSFLLWQLLFILCFCSRGAFCCIRSQCLFAEVANKLADASGEVIRSFYRKKFEILDKDDLNNRCLFTEVFRK